MADKKTLEVVYSNSMKINRGNYEQEAPFYSIKSIIEVDSSKDIESVSTAEYEQLQAIIEPLLKSDYDKKRTDLVNVRIREKDGKQYPSVTSIIKPDGLYKGIKNLEAYKERGNQLDKIVKNYLLKDKLYKPREDKFEPLKWEYDVEGFIKEYGLDEMDRKDVQTDVEVFNDEYMYSGEIDILYRDTIIDVKSGRFDFIQVAAYGKCIPTAKNLEIWDFKTGKIVSLPINECIKEWEQFLVKRGEFKARFGI
jgi:hypothetical protein